jgi:large subunit ribosomal protein L30
VKPKLKIRMVRSLSNRPHPQYRIIAGLGLRKIGSEVIVDNTPSFRGMVKKVLHLVTVEEVEA